MSRTDKTRPWWVRDLDQLEQPRRPGLVSGDRWIIAAGCPSGRFCSLCHRKKIRGRHEPAARSSRSQAKVRLRSADPDTL